MALFAGSVVSIVAETLFDTAKTEVSYLCCFNTHVKSFEDSKERLTIIRSEVLKHIEEAKRRNETQVEEDVLYWLDKSNVIIQEDKKARKKWFHGWCPNCIWQYRQGKELAEKMQRIEDLIEISYGFYRVAYPAVLPDIQYYSRASFIDFESRKSRWEELVEALEIGNYNMIGLHGLGGTGKTTMAVQVGTSVRQSKAFEKVIFVVVSDHPNINRIQAEIADHLDLYLEEREEAERSKVLWSRIANVKGRLLIILDDVWSAPNLKDIGIPFGNDHKSCCVLVTSRDVGVCREMRCQLTIQLQTLTDEDALNLFMTHVSYNDLSRNDLNDIAKAVVKECKGLPIAIAVIARSLKNRPMVVWKDALRTLQDSQPWVDVDEHFSEVYKCLQLSYYNLRNEKAQKLFLLCSLLPKDYEIRLSLLISLAIGAGIFGEIYKYWEARSQALEVKNKLIDCSLLLKVEKEGVKMPELVREAAWWMAKEDTQMIMNSKVTPKSDLRFLFWSGYDFPNQFHCKKLEVLFLWIKGYVKVEDANANFEKMGSLRVLFLCCDAKNHLELSLQSFLVLKNIRTLILNGWKLYDISILKNLQSLETLELNDCSIIELAKEVKDLKKLKLLGLRRCSILNNPFELIGRCSQLEELYFVDNGNVEDWKLDKVGQDIPPPALQIYSIACSGFDYFDDDDDDMTKCFNTKDVMNLMSGSMFQYLVEKAEVLELGGMEGTGWRSLVPDIIGIKDGAMDDLIKLCLYERYGIGYLIDASELVSSDVRVFSKLVELHMRDVEVEGLCLGPIPSGFLQQLQVLKLSRCMKLLNIFLDGSLKLPKLKVLKLENCPMFQPSLFKRSVAASLAQLEELVIEDCAELRSLIASDESLGGEMADADHQNNYDLLFPSLQTLEINGCDKLEMVSPLLLAGDLPLLQDLCIRYCEQLKYVFDEYGHEGQFLHQLTLLPSLTKIDLYWVPSLVNIFRKCEKWMQKPPPIVKDDSKEKHANSKTRATHTNIAVPKAKMQTISLESRGSMKGIEIVFTAECLLRTPLYFQSMRQMKLWEVSNISSLFSVPIAETTMLEELEISYCEELKHLITNDGEDYDHKNRRSIFPKLQTLHIHNCDHLEFIFPSTLSGGLQKLKHLTISGAFRLKYVFGSSSNANETHEFHIDLPALEALSLDEVPNMISICINSHHLKSDAAKATKMHMQNVTSPGAKNSEIEEIINVERPSSKYGFNFNNLQQIRIIRSPRLKTLFSTSTWRILPQLSKLYIWECDFLRSVVEDDSKDYGLHINYSSIFPKLEDLQIRECMNLEFIFPCFLSGGLQKLKHLIVKETPKLRYIFGGYFDEDYWNNENESDEVQVDLSALETLSLAKVPNMINICAQKHTILKLPSLQKIALDNCQELTLSARPSADSTLYWKPVAAKDLMRVIMQQQKLTSLEVEECITEEIFNFGEYGEVEGTVSTLKLELMRLTYLRELRCICRGRKHVLRLHSLCKLEIKSCPELKVVFSASMSKSLPQLSDLRIEDCQNLVQLIEEDDEEDANDEEDNLHQHCFPKLEYIGIEHCDSLKFLFSISESRMLPKLHSLQIVEAAMMEKVFKCEEDDIQKMALKDAFPTLSTLILRRLPCLDTICGWINFHTVQEFEMVDCPRYQGPQDKAATMELPSAQEMPHMGPNFGKKVVLKLDLHDNKAKQRAMKIVSVTPGVEAVSLDSKEKKLTVIGEVDPLNVVRKLRKVWYTEIVSVGPAKEPETKKDEWKEDDDKTNKEHNLLTSTSPNFGESVIESIEEEKETDKELGKVVVPALELTTSPKVTEMTSPGFRKKVVLMLDLHDVRAKNKAMQMVHGIQGVESISVDMNEKKMTLIGDIDQMNVVSKLRKVWHTELVSVEPTEEPEKKKDECKKDDGKIDKEHLLTSTSLLNSTSPNFAESSQQAMGISDVEEAPIPPISTASVMESSIEGDKETEKEIGKVVVPALELTTAPKLTEMASPVFRMSSRLAMRISGDEEAPFLLISSEELENEQLMSERTVQLQHQDRGNDMIWRERSFVESIEYKELEEFLQSLFESIGRDKETEKEVGKVVARDLELITPPKVSSMKETDEQGLERHDGLKEAIIIKKQSEVPLDNSLGNEFARSKETVKNNVVGMEASAAAASLNAKEIKIPSSSSKYSSNDTSFQIVSVGPAKEPESKKDEWKEDDDKTNKEHNLLTSTLPNFGESVIESIEEEKETDKELGKVVVPALELTTSPKVTEMTSPGFRKKVVLKLDLHDVRAKYKAMQMVYGIQGVESISLDMNEKKLTLIGDIDQMNVVSKLRKVWHTELVSVELAEEPKKKEYECKEDDGKIDKEHLLTSTSRNFTESSQQAMGISDVEEAPIPPISSVGVMKSSIEGDKETEKEIGKVVVPALELTNAPKLTEMASPVFRMSSRLAMRMSGDEEAPFLLISSEELENEQLMSERTVQLQHQDRGNDMIWRERSFVESIEYKEAEEFLQSLFESIERDKETEKEVGKVVARALELITPPKVSSMKKTDEQGLEWHDGLKEAIIIKKQSEVPLDNSLGNEFARSKETMKNNVVGMEASAATVSLNAKLASVGETLEQGLQEHYTSKNIQSDDSKSKKQSTVPLDMEEIGRKNKETMKQGLQENYLLEESTRIIQSANSLDLTKQSMEPFRKFSEKDFAEIVRRIKETMKQNLQENYAPEEAVRVTQSPTSDVTKQSTEPFLKLSEDFAQSTKQVSKNVEEVTATEMPPMSTPFEMEFKRSLTIKETRGASIEDRPLAVKPTRVNISNDVISSLHRQSQIDSDSPSSSSIFEIGEILELVELKDDERALLVKTLELYPKLRLSHLHRPIIAFAYRVLIDILIMLSTKNPYTTTEADKSNLEANLGAANYFGFDKDWVESVRAKVFDMNIVDVLATREKMLVMEAELEAHDSALGQMRKERVEAKERLAMARRKLEMAQSEFEVIDSQMLGLLVDYRLITKMVETGEVSAQYGTFGI